MIRNALGSAFLRLWEADQPMRGSEDYALMTTPPFGCNTWPVK